MKSAFLVSTAGVLIVFNWMILDREQLLDSAQTVYLELAPRDPRSLLQGDYMVLNYVVTGEAGSRVGRQARSGWLVLRLDARRVGHLARIDNGQPLAADEIRIRFTRNQRVEIGAESFFFQEGTADRYQSASYAALQVAPDGDCVLTGLLDSKLQPTMPDMDADAVPPQ
ncbi:MAG: GDYXXLXY domain-containing protein [Planctomycetaceae bacterium]